jgi:Raf kinase inhibitor-like YbhB/YbcL family protein
MRAPIFASVLVLGSCAFLLTNCGSSDGGSNTPTAGNTGVAGGGAGAPAAAAGAPAGGSPAGGSPAGGGGSSSVGGGSAGTATGGSVGTAGGGAANAGSSQGGSAGAHAGAAGQATGGGASAGAGGQGGGSSSGFALTSSKLTAGMTFPTDFTCAGANHSPPFAWGPGPSTTLSYALVLQDTNNNLNHWVLWDIPAATSTLSESLETTAALTMPAGAKQKAYTGVAYRGPCPSGMVHTYKFTLYALDVATLPGLTTSSMPDAVVTAIQAHDLASASLSATSDATQKP